MNDGSSDLLKFKPHKIDRHNSLRNYFGLAWQFNYQKSKQKNVPTKIVGTQNLLLQAPLFVDQVNYQKFSTAF
jgi:hypothetical protein